VDAAEAISALEAVVSSLLVGASPAGILVSPTRVAPTGLGSFVGPSRDPAGAITGTRVDAAVRVTVEGNSVAAVNTAAGAVTTALLGADRASLVEDGILRVGLGSMSDRESVQGQTLRQDLTFQVLYEFLKLPEAGEGIIEEVPLVLRTLDPSEGALVDELFGSASIHAFEVVDDPRATVAAPSSWTYDADERAIVQQAAIRGGPNTANANKPGTYLLLRTAPDRPAVRDFVLETTFRSDSAEGGVGLVFRYRDPDNFYLFHADPDPGYRLLGKKVDGSFSQLSLPALDAGDGFAVGVQHALRLEVAASTFRVLLDDALILEGGDTDLPSPGRVGLATRRNDAAFFFGMKLVPT
jgi:hypothetical protein